MNNVNTPLVSILLPVFNSEKFITQCVNSALRQTYTNIEVIAVDNASEDKTFEILNNLAMTDNRLKVFLNKTNIGPVRNWKKCIEYANGVYGKILWSDDFISDDFITYTLPYLEENEDVGFVITKIQQVDENSATTRELFSLANSGLYDSKEYISKMLLSRSKLPVSPGCGLFRLSDIRKNLILEIPNRINSNFSQHGIGSDLLIFLLTANDYKRYAYVNRKLSYFRVHKNSITTFTKQEELDVFYNIAKVYFVEKHVYEKKLLKKFNTILLLTLIKYRKNKWNIKSIHDFYNKKIDVKIDYVFFLIKIIKNVKVKKLIKRSV